MKNNDTDNAGSDRPKQTDNLLHQLFLAELSELYDVEKQLIKALPKMSDAAQSDELRAAFDSHLEETETHATRLEEVAKSLDTTLKRRKSKGMEGILAEADKLISQHKGKPSIDAALIAAAQKAEHYEIACYGTVYAWADEMGHGEAVDLLQETLAEEKEADQKLTEIGRSFANGQASHA